jgi:hypothetical protein
MAPSPSWASSWWRVETVTPLLAPSYRFVPGTTEASQVASALEAYGVRAR